MIESGPVSSLKRFPILPTFVFILIAAFWVWFLEPRGWVLDVMFGLRFVKYYVFPVGFWGLAFLFAAGLTFYTREPLRNWFLRILPFGITVHLGLLFMQFLVTRTSASLNASYFSLYCDGVAVVGIGLSLYCLWAFFLSSPSSQNVALRLPDVLKSTTFWLTVIFLIGLSFRLIAAYRLSGMGLQTVLTNSDDAQAYYPDALALLRGEKIPGYFSVGEAIMVALVIKLVGTSIRAILLTQAFICAFLPVLVYFIASRFTSKLVALFGALGCAVSHLLIFNSANLTRESFGGLLICASFLVFLKLWESKTTRERSLWAVVFSLVAGVLLAIDVSLQIAFFLLTFIWAIKLEKVPYWKRAAWFFVLLMGPKLVMATVSWKATGQFHLLGRNISAARALNVSYSPEAIELSQKKHIDIFVDPAGSVVNFFKDFQGNSILMLRKWRNDFLYYFFEGFSGSFDPVILVRISTLAGNLNFYLYLFGFLGFFQLAYKCWQAPFEKPARALMLLFMFGSATPYILLFLGHTRYRVAIQPFIVICCVSGVVKSLEWVLHKISSFSRERVLNVQPVEVY